MSRMDKTQPVRITSDTGLPFAACTNLPVRQEMLNKEMMRGITGGNPYAAVVEKVVYSILAYEALNEVWKPASEYIVNTAQSGINAVDAYGDEISQKMATQRRISSWGC